MSAVTDGIRIAAIRFFETVAIDMSDAPNDERLHMSRRLVDTLEFVAPLIVSAKDARIAELEDALAVARDAALEEAARAAINCGEKYAQPVQYHYDKRDGCYDAAAAIRAMKGQQA